MSALRLIAYIAAAILIFFGVLFIWGAFSPQGNLAWILIGAISVGIGFAIIWFTSRRRATAEDGQASQNVTLQIDLPGDVTVDRLTCTACGADLGSDDVKLVSGAAVVNCPYCGATYQLTEQPKW